MKKSSILLACLAVLSLPLTNVAMADDDGDKPSRGVVICGGNNFLRVGGTELQFTSYNLRNQDSDTAITIEKMRAFSASGAVIFDSAISGLPLAANAILGPSDNTLEPNQTAQLLSYDFLPFLAQNDRPIQVEITWSALNRVLPLAATSIRVSRARDAVTGAQREERGRDSSSCVAIKKR